MVPSYIHCEPFVKSAEANYWAALIFLVAFSIDLFAGLHRISSPVACLLLVLCAFANLFSFWSPPFAV